MPDTRVRVGQITIKGNPEEICSLGISDENKKKSLPLTVMEKNVFFGISKWLPQLPAMGDNSKILFSSIGFSRSYS